jgi:serine/threonine protein phosphatase PrpC
MPKHAFAFEGYGNSHPGNYSKHNEDMAFIGSSREQSLAYDELAVLAPTAEDEVFIFAVADGVGGSEAGEDASVIAIHALQRYMREQAAKVDAGNVAEVLQDCISEVHHAIVADAKQNPSKDGMASTLTAVCVFPFGAWLIQVGDSRLYAFRNGKLRQISEDQSPVGKLVRELKITEEESMIHPLRNYIDQALGASDQAPVGKVSPVDFKDRDVWLLCTDGLSDSLYPEQIQSKFREDYDGSLEQLGCNLIDAALSAAGRDNLSVVLCRPHAQNGLKRLAASFSRVARTAFSKCVPNSDTP